MSHKQLTEDQRYHIYRLWRAGTIKFKWLRSLALINQRLVESLREIVDGKIMFQAKLSIFVMIDVAQLREH
jgi:hypothetical protein